MPEFEDYLKAAMVHALSTASNDPNEELKYIVALCEGGATQNRSALGDAEFLRQILWCVGSQQKRYSVRMSAREGGTFWEQQQALFLDCNPATVVSERASIRRASRSGARYLSPAMVSAVLDVADEIIDTGWDKFRDHYLLLPVDPDDTHTDAWLPLVRRLDSLPRVGPTTAWYLLRNLLGAPVLKPDVHVLAIAWDFFGDLADPLEALRAEAIAAWPRMHAALGSPPNLPADPHLGVIDYILWWFRSQVGEPAVPRHEPPASYC